MGTSTFVAAMLDQDEPVLYGLNLGDSGYMIVRPMEATDTSKVPYELMYRTTE